MRFTSLAKWIAHQLVDERKRNCYSFYVLLTTMFWRRERVVVEGGWMDRVIALVVVVGWLSCSAICPEVAQQPQDSDSDDDDDDYYVPRSQMVHLFIPVYLFIADAPSTKFILNNPNHPRSSSSSSSSTAAAAVASCYFWSWLAGWMTVSWRLWLCQRNLS